MANVQKSQTKWKQAHNNISRVLIASLLKKFDGNKKEVADELGIAYNTVCVNINKLGLTRREEIDKYAIGMELLSKAPQTTNQKPAQTNKVA